MVLIRKKKKKTQEELEAERKEKDLRKSGIQDEFQAKGFELVSWVQHHRTTIIIGLMVFTGVLIAWGSYSVFGSRVDTKAVAEFDAALKLYDGATAAKDDKVKKQQEAMKSLDSFLKNNTGNLARLANLFKGHLAIELGDGKAAAQSYKAFVDASQSDDPLRTLGLLGLAAAYDMNGDLKNALATYETILSSNVKIDEAMVLWHATRLAKALKQEKKVEEFEKKRKSFKLSAFSGPIPDVSL